MLKHLKKALASLLNNFTSPFNKKKSESIDRDTPPYLILNNQSSAKLCVSMDEPAISLNGVRYRLTKSNARILRVPWTDRIAYELKKRNQEIYRRKNRDLLREKNAIYREKNREAINLKKKEYRLKSKEYAKKLKETNNLKGEPLD